MKPHIPIGRVAFHAIEVGVDPRFDLASAYCRFIEKAQGAEIEWMTVPDIVGDSKTTSALFKLWQPSLEGLPLAYVAQDGLEIGSVPWRSIQCLFIGGSTEWKLSYDAACLVNASALNEDKHVHMGRVNSDKRLRYAYDLGCHSIDGTGYSRLF